MPMLCMICILYPTRNVFSFLLAGISIYTSRRTLYDLSATSDYYYPVLPSVILAAEHKYLIIRLSKGAIGTSVVCRTIWQCSVPVDRETRSVTIADAGLRKMWFSNWTCAADCSTRPFRSASFRFRLLRRLRHKIYSEKQYRSQKHLSAMPFFDLFVLSEGTSVYVTMHIVKW